MIGRSWIFILILFAGLLAGCASIEHQKGSHADATFYLVRHAEKILGVDDPALTGMGHKRARDLAVRLKDVPLTAIYTTDYKRTRQTAQPVSELKDLKLQFYDPKALELFADQMVRQSGSILIVGHSNTTPDSAMFLGGEAGPAIDEASEYDRLYILTRRAGATETEITRYGD